MAYLTLIAHKCFFCGDQLGYVNDMEHKNYVFWDKKHICKECFEVNK